MGSQNHRRDDFDMPSPPPPSPGDESLLMSLIEIATDLQSGSGKYYNSEHDVSDLFDSYADLDDLSLLSEINNVSFDSFLDTLRSEAGRTLPGAAQGRTGQPSEGPQRPGPLSGARVDPARRQRGPLGESVGRW